MRKKLGWFRGSRTEPPLPNRRQVLVPEPCQKTGSSVNRQGWAHWGTKKEQSYPCLRKKNSGFHQCNRRESSHYSLMQEEIFCLLQWLKATSYLRERYWNKVHSNLYLPACKKILLDLQISNPWTSITCQIIRLFSLMKTAWILLKCNDKYLCWFKTHYCYYFYYNTLKEIPDNCKIQ